MLKLLKAKGLISFILFMSLALTPVFADNLAEFKKKAVDLKWIAYAPTNFDPTKEIYPSAESIRQDLELLYKYGFNGIVTYGSDNSLGEIPEIACLVGFKGVIMGIWDIANREEIANAVLASKYVDAYCVGNEGLNSRYDIDLLNKTIALIKQATHRPATTTEQVFDYANGNVFAVGDWIFPNIHPFLSDVKDTPKAIKWIKNHYRILKRHCPENKFILFKEVGFPTAGLYRATEANQEDFFLKMEETDIPFVYFEAFDQPWKRHLPCEPHWGLFNHKRKPKKYASFLYKNDTCN